MTEEWAGSHIEKPLMKDGCSTPVTNKNRDKYIHLYIKYFLETSISKQFEAFSRGFDKVRRVVLLHKQEKSKTREIEQYDGSIST